LHRFYNSKLSRGFRILFTAGIFFLAFSWLREPEAAARSFPIRADSLFYFKGRVVDSISRRPVAFTHIINTGRNTATICDTLGYFYIRVRLNDTLRFSAIGYAPLMLFISDSLRALERLPDIPLRGISYSIRGVMINPLGSYTSFKYRVASLQLPPTGYEINPTVLKEIEQGTYTLDMVQYPAISPITALYNWLSKEGKSRRKLAKLIEQEQFEKEITYKYSPIIVSGITGYSGFELYCFMDFCSFSMKFLRESDRYVIRDAVLEKQKIFEALKEE
jgi:hypothetical protein